MSPAHLPPPRLVETDGPAGDCLRRALSEGTRTPEPPPFSALRDRRQRRIQRQVSLGAVLAAAALLIGLRAASRHQDEALSVRAEVASVSPRPRAEPSALVEPSPALPEPLTSSKPAPEAKRPRTRPALPRIERKLAAEIANPPQDTGRRSARGCAELARGADAEQALACYQELAKGTGITAELALFEQARLEGKALRRPEQALRTLDSYRGRFPNGSLRAEVMLAQIDWLLRTGDRLRASQLVDEALTSGLLQERRAELERLRDTLSSP